jgi:hypothetical protein
MHFALSEFKSILNLGISIWSASLENTGIEYEKGVQIK